MDRHEALQMLRDGDVKRWNHGRQQAEELPALSGADLHEANLSAANFRGANLSGADLHEANLSGADLHEANLSAANFRGANLSGANFSKANLSGAKLSGAILIGADFGWTNFGGTDLSAILLGSSFSKANLSGANLSGANLNNWNLSGANFNLASLRLADLRDANFRGANLSRADLNGANLSGADLNGADLSQAKLVNAQLFGADLSQADLSGAYLCDASLNLAKLSHAELTKANLSDADLSNATITHAHMKNASLSSARFIGTDLTGTIVENAIVTNLLLHDLKGLPVPPTVLRIHAASDSSSGQFIELTGEKALNFFLQPETVEVVLDQALPDELLAGYHVSIGEMKARSIWPTEVSYLGGRIEGDRNILSFQAPKAEDIVANLATLLAPFRMAQAVDFAAALDALTVGQAENAVDAIVRHNALRPLIEKRLPLTKQLQEYRGFGTAVPVEARTAFRTIQFGYDEKKLAHLKEGGDLPPLQLQLVENTENVLGDKVEDKQEFHGHVTGSATGKGARVNAQDISADFRGSNLNIKSTLQNAAQTAQTLPNADEAAKHELEKLMIQLNDALQKHAVEKPEDTEAIAVSAKDLVEKASKEKPNNKLLEISAKGLKEAAEAIKDVVPIAISIIKTVAGFAGIPTP